MKLRARRNADGSKYPDAVFVFSAVAPRLFETLRLPMVLGRDFTLQDGPSSPKVAIVNESMARKYFPGGNPVGRRIVIEDKEPGVQRTIVGVVKDMKFSFRSDMPAEAAYLPYAQAPAEYRGQAMIKVSTSIDPSAVTPAIREQVRQVAKDLPPLDIVSEDQLLAEEETSEERSLGSLLGGFGALALGLALLGLYGTVSYSVSRRVREIAIRMALGAQREGVLWMVLGEALRFVLAGVAIGAVLAVIAARSLESFLFGVQGFDPLTYALLMALLIVAALGAAYVPAHRAMKVDPMVALRCE